MQFFKAATFLSLGLLCQSSVIPIVERQGGSVTDLSDIVDAVSGAVLTNLGAVTTAVLTSLGAQGPVIAAIQTDIVTVTAELIEAGQIISNTTLTLGTTLAAPEIALLTTTLVTAQTLAITYQTLLVTLAVTLNAASQELVEDEIAAAISAFTPFTGPLLTYAGTVQAATDLASGVAWVGLQVAAGTLTTAVSTLIGF